MSNNIKEVNTQAKVPKNVLFDNSKLRGLVYEKYRSIAALARDIGLCRIVLQEKINGVRPLKQNEMWQMIQLLGIPCDDVAEYFFKVKE